MEQLDRQCEKFMGGPTLAHGERVHVTISPKGAIFLNEKAHKMIGSPAAVYLYFNRPKDMIILEPTSALTASNASSSAQTSAPAATSGPTPSANTSASASPRSKNSSPPKSTPPAAST